MARKRKTFGPLFYSTVVVAALIAPFGVALQIQEWLSRETTAAAEVKPEVKVAALLPALNSDDPAARLQAIESLGALLRNYGPFDDTSGPRVEAIKALRMALRDQDPSMRAAAAESLGGLSRWGGESATGELTAALKDAEPTVRLAAAKALLTITAGDSAPALRVLTRMATDPFIPDRIDIITAMTAAGEKGEDAAAGVLVTLLSNEDDALRADAANCLPALGQAAQRIVPALEPILKSNNPGLRFSAALAAMKAAPQEQRPNPLVLSVLERAVTDTSLSILPRQQAIAALYSGQGEEFGVAGGMPGFPAGSVAGWPSPVADAREVFRRCGRELARQLDNDDEILRVTAARLLHMIDPDTLTGKTTPAKAP
jgi:HEAT repeat protein